MSQFEVGQKYRIKKLKDICSHTAAKYAGQVITCTYVNSRECFIRSDKPICFGIWFHELEPLPIIEFTYEIV